MSLTGAAQSLLQLATQYASKNGDTAVLLKRAHMVDVLRARNFMLRASGDDDAAFDQLVGALGAAVLRADPGRAFVVLEALVPNAAASERAVCDAVAAPVSAGDRGPFGTHCVGVSGAQVQSGTDAEVVADAVLDLGLWGVAIVATADTFSPARGAAIRASLCAKDPAAAAAYTVPYVPLAGADRAVPKSQRQLLVVDRGHALGTADWQQLVRLQARGVRVVGCRHLQALHPGLTLAHVFPSTSADSLLHWAKDELLPAFLARATLAAAPPEHYTLLLHSKAERGSSSSSSLFAPRSVYLAQLTQACDASSPSCPLVAFERTLRRLTLQEWTWLLCYGSAAAACVLILASPATSLSALLDTAPCFTRRLASRQ